MQFVRKDSDFLIKRTRKMSIKSLGIFIGAILISIASLASPARRGGITLTQPDGTSFKAYLTGDEFTRIKTTADGHAIVQDSDGWWCYAMYDSDGTKTSSGHRVGTDDVPGSVTMIQDIPYAAIGDHARRARQSALIRQTHPLTASVRTRTTPGARHGIVILAQFENLSFTHTREDFVNLLMQKDYDLFGSNGSAKDYFDAQFNGLLEFSFDVSEIVTLPGKYEFYGKNNTVGNDSRPEEMVMDACRIASENGVDFSIYDYDNDGYVDNVFVFFAGEDEAEGADENTIWSHAWYIYSGAGKTLMLNGKVIDRYACTSELTRIYDTNGSLLETHLSGIGTFCHEYSHTFGLPDFYDTDYDEKGGWTAGLWGNTSLMDSGNQNNGGNTPPNYNVIERMLLGLAEPQLIDKDGTYTLQPVNLSGECLRMDTDREEEYYLFECRSDSQDIWDRYIGGNGMLVYHIDRTEDVMKKWTLLNTVNADGSHQCADLVEADGRSDIFTGQADLIAKMRNISGIFFPYGETGTLTPTSTPGLKFWSGEEGVFSVVNITRTDDGGISFNVIGGSEESTPPTIQENISHEVFADGAIIGFESSRPFDGEAVVRYGRTNQDITTVTVMPYESGRYSIALDSLMSAKTYTVSISFSINGIEGASKSVSFMTKKAPAVEWPYIFFGSAVRNNNGTFRSDSRIPLKVYNASEAKEIRWTYNDASIQAEGDHYFTLPGSGTLKAHIFWEDGTEEILMKEIRISPTRTE